MKTRSKQTDECSAVFEIDVSETDIQKAFDEVYDEITKVANIPGFRTGKAPKELVRKHYSKNAREEVLKRVIPDAYRVALEEHKTDPVGLPEISDVNFQDEKKLSFKARVDTRPKFNLKNYKGIKVTKKKAVVSDDDVKKVLDNLREVSAQYETPADRPVQMGDYVVSDLECAVDGKSAHKKRENLWILMDKDSIVPGLADHMVGMKKGEEKDIELMMPEKYPDKNLAGKTAKYHVAAKDIKVRALPELTDDFAKKFNKSSLDELKKEIALELEERAKVSGEVEAENQLLNRLIEDNNFKVPPGFVKRQLEYMVEDAKRHLVEKGFKKEDLDKKDDELKEKFKADAARRVRLLFILDTIARAEKIETTDSDVGEAYKSISAQSGKTEAEVKAYYEKEDLVEGLRDKIRETQTIKFLMDNAEKGE